MNLPPKTLNKQGFTLIELLVVIAIIAVLASLVLAAAGSVQKKGARSRAEAEIKAVEAALESYKADNGDYPTNSFGSGSPNLVAALMNTNTAGSKIYFEFKFKNIDKVIKPGSYLDPYGNPYEYTYTNGSPNNGTNNYDLWSTAGGSTNTNAWIKNW